MKKLIILTSILALTACGCGSGGSGSAGITNNPSNPDTPNAPVTFGNTEIPNSRVSSVAADSNSAVTGMDSSVTNIAEMTAAVESVIGTEALNNIASNSEKISDLMNRSASSRNAARGAQGHHSNKEKAANGFVEWGRIFRNWGHDKRRDFYREKPDVVKGWGKTFCGCDVESFNEDQLLAIFDNPSNQARWDDFYDKYHYREFTLEDVDFTMSSASNGDEDGGLDIVRFELDNNAKITGVKLYAFNSNEIGHEDTQNTEDDAYFTRSSDDSNVFNFVQERDERLFDGTVVRKRIQGTATVETYGDKTGNRYSDFGRFIVNAEEYVNDVFDEPQVSYEPFAGGYNDKKITNLPSESMSFTGKAVGTIKGRNNGNDLQVNGNATLEFDGAEQNQTLSMNFGNWYNVTIDKNLNSDQLKFTFDGTLAAENSNYALDNMGTGHKEVVIENPGNYNGTGYENNSLTKGKLQINYYGDNGNPEEFVGVTQYVESIPSEHEVRVNLGFGGVRDNQ